MPIKARPRYLIDASSNEVLRFDITDQNFCLLTFEKSSSGDIVKFSHTNNGLLTSEIDFGKLKPKEYQFELKGTVFAIEYSNHKILIPQPKFSTNKSIDSYLVDLLHEIGHAHLHRSQGTGMQLARNELEAWIYALDKLATLGSLEIINTNTVLNHIAKCLASYRNKLIRDS